MLVLAGPSLVDDGMARMGKLEDGLGDGGRVLGVSSG